MDDQEKVCKGCGKSKPLDQFNKNASCKFGRDPFCKPCQSERNKDPKVRNQPNRLKRWADGQLDSLKLDGRDY